MPGLFIAAAGASKVAPILAAAAGRCRGGGTGETEQTKAMASPSVVSFLGIPGWGALHLQRPGSAEPAAMAKRLRRAQEAAGAPCPPAALLAAFLRQERDALPLARPWGALPRGLHRQSHRYRIVCPPGPGDLQVRAWCWHGTARGWRSCGRSLAIGRFVERFDPARRGGEP